MFTTPAAPTAASRPLPPPSFDPTLLAAGRGGAYVPDPGFVPGYIVSGAYEAGVRTPASMIYAGQLPRLTADDVKASGIKKVLMAPLIDVAATPYVPDRNSAVLIGAALRRMLGPGAPEVVVVQTDNAGRVGIDRLIKNPQGAAPRAVDLTQFDFYVRGGMTDEMRANFERAGGLKGLKINIGRIQAGRGEDPYLRPIIEAIAFGARGGINAAGELFNAVLNFGTGVFKGAFGH